MRRKYLVNEDYFAKIDKEQAYWLGFIFADGNVYKSTLSIKLHSRDLNLIKKFLYCINSSHPIRKVKNKKAHVVKIHSKKIVENLSLYGVVPNKSKIIVFPKNLQHIDAFILGFLDGDGWITTKNKNLNIGFSSSSKKFIKAIQSYFIKLGMGKGSLFSRKNNKHHQLIYSTQPSIKICEILYSSSSIFIKRKYSQYLKGKKNYINNFSKRSSIYYGVCIEKANTIRKWKSYVQYKSKKIILGYFEKEIDAAREYNNFIKNHKISSFKMNII